MTYILFASREGAEWSVNSAELVEFIAQDWPGVEFQAPTPLDFRADGRGLRWIAQIEGNEIEAWLNKAATCLYVDGEFDGVAKLVAWFLQKMPCDVEFSMCDESYSFDVAVERGPSARDILESIPD